MAKKIVQNDLIKQYFIQNPNRDIAHPKVFLIKAKNCKNKYV